MHIGQVGDHVGQHAAGDLVDQGLGIGAHGLGVDAAVVDVLLLHGLEVIVDLVDDLLIQAGLNAQLAEGVVNGLGSGLAGAVGEAGGSGVDDVHTGFHSLHNGHVGHAGGAVGMQDQGQGHTGILDALEQLLSLVGAHGTGHVLQADGVEAHALQLLAHLSVLGGSVNRRLGVGDAAGSHGVGGGVLLGCLQSSLDVAEIVQSVEDTQNVDAVLDGQLHELLHHIIVVVLVAKQVLAPEQHLQTGVGHSLAERAQALPGILVQVAQAAVKGSAAPALDGIVAGLIHGGQDALHVAVSHTGRHQGLVGITKDGFSELDFLSHLVLTSVEMDFDGR